jgi:hypothetical protein
MNVGLALIILADLVNTLKADGLLLADGTFKFPPGIQPELRLAKQIEELLKSHGVAIDENVDKVLGLLPLVLQLANVK